MRRFFFVALSALAIAACGSSGGTSTPPPPPAPVTPPAPPPPPPEPTFEERLADLAAFDPNPCRAETPGFEALGGWLKNDGRELGGSRVWIDDVGTLDQPLSESHGARVWASFTACAARSDEEHYNEDGALHWESIRADGGDGIKSISSAPFWEDIDLPEPGVWAEYPYVRAGIQDRAHDGNRDGQRLLRLAAAGNAIGATAGWRLGDLTLQGGIAAQPEEVGSLTGSRAFCAPSTIPAAITAADGKTLGYGFSAHIQADDRFGEARTFVSPASPQHWSSEQGRTSSRSGAHGARGCLDRSVWMGIIGMSVRRPSPACG